MAVGDSVVYGAYNVGASSTFDVQPSAGVEVLIHTIEYQTAKTGFTVKRTTDGSNFAPVESGTATEHGLMYRATNTNWLRFTNSDAGAAGLFAIGVQTK